MSQDRPINEVQWDKEHPLFKGTFFGEWKHRRRKYTLVKGRLVGGYSIGGNFDGKYQEIHVETEEEMNEILIQLRAS